MHITSAPVSTLNVTSVSLILSVTSHGAVFWQSIAPRKNDGVSLASHGSCTSLTDASFFLHAFWKWLYLPQYVHFFPCAGQTPGCRRTYAQFPHFLPGSCGFVGSFLALCFGLWYFFVTGFFALCLRFHLQFD